jgi:ATP synthase protein I
MSLQENTEDSVDNGFVPLTPEQARRFRQSYPSISPWRVVGGQVVMGLVLVLLTWALTQKRELAVSAGCGSLAVIVPAAFFARGLMGRFANLNPANAVTSFFIWELVKIGTTVAVLLAAHHWVDRLSWPAMLVGLVVTMKVYWLALLFNGKHVLVDD